ncbi:MAG TPA: HAD family phosphatase [Candidatus Angelobacter sp.]|nr:HAD family phosphatase [Candidatus Angelobacter sp.]
MHHWAWRGVLARFGVDLPWMAYAERCIGQGLPSIVRNLAEFSAGSVSSEALMEEYPRKDRAYRVRMLETPPVYEETVALLAEIRLPMAVVTSNGREEIEPILNALSIHNRFSAFVFREDVTRHKPDPAPYIRAAQLLNAINPLVVEDSEAGCLAALAAGFEWVKIQHPRSMATSVRKKLGLSK